MHLRTFTTLTAVTTAVSALAAPAPPVHHAVAVVGPEVTQPPSIEARQSHGAFRAEPRPKSVDAEKLKKRYDSEGDWFPTGLSPTLKPLYTSCAIAYETIRYYAPEPSGPLKDWLSNAIDGDQDSRTATSSADHSYAAECGTYTSPLTPPASLASTYSDFSSASASYFSAHQAEITSLANACKPVYDDVLFSLLMPHQDYEACTSAYENYMIVYASYACARHTQDCSLTSAYPPKTTGTGAAAAAATTTTMTAAGAGVTGASGSGSAGASSTTTLGNAGAPKQTFAAAAALAGFIAAVAAL